MSWRGCIASLVDVARMARVTVNLRKDLVIEGWTTLSLQIAVMFFFLFTTLMVTIETSPMPSRR